MARRSASTSALIAADQLSGLITAAALVRPDKDLAGVKVKSVRKRYREGAFARGVDRESIARCEELGIELDEFFALGLEAMQGVAPRARPLRGPRVDSSERRAPDFCAESEAYTLFRRGADFLDDGHPAQAAMYLSRALSSSRGRNSIREALGRAEFALGRYEHAAELFGAVVADVPDNDYAHYALARCLRALGRGEEARGHLRLARALHPACETYRRRLDGVD